MTKLLPIFTLVLLISCQTDNSNSFDPDLANSQIDPINTNLVKSYKVIQDRCISCHTGYHNSWASYTTDQAWIDSGNITAGVIGDSPLVTKLKNRGGNMPIGGPNLTNDEYDAIVTWIEAL
ncbi:cytochrome c [Bacteriovorax sp. DB6_IX]|uniref:cytochrome c n=1 Tax=Bacteriovorax sp. DB6_IX TaxID=1353530 RepID=UPI00038A1521|nr:cytochrome c [Bacteriovorax sp. DB6_IX]EQC50414.1 putative lipoprotein [Bacteriovorax sp. DB6_IX]